MPDLMVWIDRLLEFLRLRGPSVPGVRPAAAPQGPRLRSHGMRSTSKKETVR